MNSAPGRGWTPLPPHLGDDLTGHPRLFYSPTPPGGVVLWENKEKGPLGDSRLAFGVIC